MLGQRTEVEMFLVTSLDMVGAQHSGFNPLVSVPSIASMNVACRWCSEAKYKHSACHILTGCCRSSRKCSRVARGSSPCPIVSRKSLMPLKLSLTPR